MDGYFSDFAKISRRRKRRRRYRWAALYFALGFGLGALVALTMPERLAGLNASNEKAAHANGSS